MSETFSYDAFATRNIGFVTPAEQSRLRGARVAVIGVGGMGGAAFATLVRAGIGAFTIADIDEFEISNLNRQMFAFLETVGQPKAACAAAAARRINPEVALDVLGPEWLDRIDAIAATHPVIVNGMDDIAAGIALYRAAARHGATVIDAYASVLPSVIVVRPGDPRPEERLRFPTIGRDPAGLTADERNACFLREIIWVMTHSSSADHVDLALAAEVAAGQRKRFSFAPMVTMTGAWMAQEAIQCVLGRPPGADFRGVFLNPYRGRIERPLPWPLAALRGVVVETWLKRLLAAQ
jgi:molybdopterin/thiamine biosynthesis adenylyltransferase